MKLTLKFLFFFFLLLSSAIGQFEKDFVENPEEKARQFEMEQNHKTREFIKSEMDWYFNNLWKKLTTKLERDKEALSANLSRKMIEILGNLNVTLADSLNESQTRSDLKMGSFSQTFIGRLLQIESKVTEEHGSVNKTLQKNHQQLSSLLSSLTVFLQNPHRMTNGSTNVSTDESQGEIVSISKPLVQTESLSELLTTFSPMTRTQSTTISAIETKAEITSTSKPPVQTEVEEVNLREGTIEFTGEANPYLRRKIWVFQSEGGTSFRCMRFALQENNLGPDARLSLWGTYYENGNQHVWNGSQSDWREERESKGNVILVTLLISPSASEQPSFKLKFKTIATSDTFVPSSQLVVGQGRQVVSFPPNNSQNSFPLSYFVAVVAPPSGRPFQITLKFLDLPSTSPDSCDNSIRVSFLEESPTGLPYELLPPSAFSGCAQPDVFSESIDSGNATVAIFWFWGYGMSAGKRFQIEIN